MLSQWFGKRSSCANQPHRRRIARTMRLGFDHLEDRSVPAIITISHVPAATPSNNDFTVFKNALNGASAGDTIKINGTLNWSEPNSFTSWATTGFHYILPHIDNITLTGLNASGDGITGPGTEGGGASPIHFDGLGTDKNWNITGLTIKNFDVAISYAPDADFTSYAGTHITNNVITVPNAGPASQNGGIILGPSANQTVQGNQISISGHGGASSSSFGINAFSSSSAGAWNNLLIDNNTVTVSTVGATEKIIGIAENTGSTGSNITVTNNTFHGDSGSIAGNQQVAFGITSDSTDTATVVYSGNVVNGALDGFVWGNPETNPPYDFSNDIGITFSNTTLTNVGTGFVARDGAKATIGSTTITNIDVFNFGTAFSADGAGTVITVTDPVSNSTGVAALKSETSGGHVNFVGPKVTGLSTTTVSGTYGIGSAIAITVAFDRAVSVTGTPTLLLNSGGTATYCGGTGTNSLKFKYTIAAGESSAALDAAGASALSGTIT
ncbi:hypothetical protein, partial [Zavarzinella formosa]|uniref:hypothetical protein n=1 Tax=Zavarzinella formosa TaxID=360055 RepID=UPI00187DD6AD